MRRPLAAITALLLGLSLVPTMAGASSGLTETEMAFVEEINATRAAAGVPPLTVHVQLSALSRGWAETMASNNTLAHASPISEGLTDPWRTIGENVGYGYSVSGLMDAFRNSSGHYANLVRADYTHVGVGVAFNGSQIWTTHRFFEAAGPVTQVSDYKCQGEAATMIGTTGNDMINGTAGRDVIVSFGGNDLINGRGGNDLICAGGGDDVIDGGRGSDEIYAQGGADVVVASGGRDFVHGGSGPDELRGSLGKDRVWGGGGADECWGEQMRCEIKHRTLHDGRTIG